jgi:calcium channel MID1
MATCYTEVCFPCLATFPCPLVHGVDLCPSITYAAAVDPTSDRPYDPISTISERLQETLQSSLNAFSTSLLSSACGRDLFSPVSTCADCFDEYREWLCRSILPRCASQSQTIASRNRDEAIQTLEQSYETIPMTVPRDRRNPRTPFSANPEYPYEELLPCLDNCRRVDRKCPVFLAFRCPIRGVTAKESYAYCGPDEETRGVCEGETDGGSDKWGHTWCNGFIL